MPATARSSPGAPAGACRDQSQVSRCPSRRRRARCRRAGPRGQGPKHEVLGGRLVGARLVVGSSRPGRRWTAPWAPARPRSSQVVRRSPWHHPEVTANMQQGEYSPGPVAVRLRRSRRTGPAPRRAPTRMTTTLKIWRKRSTTKSPLTMNRLGCILRTHDQRATRRQRERATVSPQPPPGGCARARRSGTSSMHASRPRGRISGSRARSRPASQPPCARRGSAPPAPPAWPRIAAVGADSAGSSRLATRPDRACSSIVRNGLGIEADPEAHTSERDHVQPSRRFRSEVLVLFVGDLTEEDPLVEPEHVGRAQHDARGASRRPRPDAVEGAEQDEISPTNPLRPGRPMEDRVMIMKNMA